MALALRMSDYFREAHEEQSLGMWHRPNATPQLLECTDTDHMAMNPALSLVIPLEQCMYIGGASNSVIHHEGSYFKK